MVPFGFVEDEKTQTPMCSLQEDQARRDNKHGGRNLQVMDPTLSRSAKKGDKAACKTKSARLTWSQLGKPYPSVHKPVRPTFNRVGWLPQSLLLPQKLARSG